MTKKLQTNDVGPIQDRPLRGFRVCSGLGLEVPGFWVHGLGFGVLRLGWGWVCQLGS